MDMLGRFLSQLLGWLSPFSPLLVCPSFRAALLASCLFATGLLQLVFLIASFFFGVLVRFACSGF